MKAKGVGAHSATNPRGLDELVSQVMATVSTGDGDDGDEKGLTIEASGTTGSNDRSHMRFDDDEEEKAGAEGKRPREGEPAKESKRAKVLAKGDDGNWHKALLLKTKKSGKVKVEFKKSGKTKTLKPDFIKPRK